MIKIIGYQQFLWKNIQKRQGQGIGRPEKMPQRGSEEVVFSLILQKAPDTPERHLATVWPTGVYKSG